MCVVHTQMGMLYMLQLQHSTLYSVRGGRGKEREGRGEGRGKEREGRKK
jgi:hypothetical protein